MSTSRGTWSPRGRELNHWQQQCTMQNNFSVFPRRQRWLRCCRFVPNRISDARKLASLEKRTDREFFENARLKNKTKKNLKMKCHLLYFIRMKVRLNVASAESCFCLTRLTEPSNFPRASESLRNKKQKVCVYWLWSRSACAHVCVCDE